MSAGQELTTGSQDLAALAGLFCTDGVERNALATQFGYGTVIVSSLSLLGILGLLKSSIKVALGLKACESAGFTLDSLRGIYGFLPGETPSKGEVYTCHVTDISWNANRKELLIRKEKRSICDYNTPLVQVGADWPETLECKTAINLGNPHAEDGFHKSSPVMIILAMLCTGATTWSLLVVDSPWTWYQIMAIPVFQACLLLMVGLPLWNERKVGRPYHYLTPERWDFLSGTNGISQLRSTLQFLQVRVNNGDAIHLQGNAASLKSKFFKCFVVALSAIACIAYLCQYAVLKSASNDRAIIWVAIQAALALIRVLYWMIDPSFDDPKTNHSEYAIVNNTWSDYVTMIDLTCSGDESESSIAEWVLEYLKTTTLRDILETSISGPRPIIPQNEEDEVYIFSGIDFAAIVGRRLGCKNSQTDRASESWRLGLAKSKEKSIPPRPFLLVDVLYNEVYPGSDIVQTHWGWMEIGSVEESPPEDRITSPSSLVLQAKNGKIIPMKGRDSQQPLSGQGYFMEHKDSGNYLGARGFEVQRWIKEVLARELRNPNDRDEMQKKPELLRRTLNASADAVWITATPATTTRVGTVMGSAGNKIDGNSESLEAGSKMVREYIVKHPKSANAAFVNAPSTVEKNSRVEVCAV